MESSPIARNTRQQSKKRVFVDLESSSSSCKGPVVIEIDNPSSDQGSKSKARVVHKEVGFHEVINVDMDDDHNDAVFLGGKARSKRKMKGKGMLSSQDAAVNINSPSSLSSRLAGSSSSKGKLVNDDAMKRYRSFKKFDTVTDYSDHHYAAEPNTATKKCSKRIQKEWQILEKDLPDTIFVRVYESRMDLLRAVIIGAEGTPYHDGLFFFDVCFPSSYPDKPPHVNYRSGGLRINPNLYGCGLVCLSLLNTWDGSKKEMWVPGKSTMLQVLVSIQGLILNMKPYFNEPGYENSIGHVEGERASLKYNESTLILSLKTMVYTMNNSPKNFEDFVVGHFRDRARDILMACKAYTEGVQVGCVVKGGVQDVDEDNSCCSRMFKDNVASYIKTLIAAFKKIGANEAEEFVHLSSK